MIPILFSRCEGPCSVKTKVAVVPKPRTCTIHKGIFKVNDETEVRVEENDLLPLGELLTDRVSTLTGLKLKTGTQKRESNQVVFRYNPSFDEEEYHLTIGDNILIEAPDYQSMAMGVATLVQMASVTGRKVVFPYVSITDKPSYGYRSVMLDLARSWHPVETIKETIDLLWFYKTRYLHLHLSDNRRFTFPLDEFPELKTINEDGSREYYTIEELTELVEYARQRGIAIIPEIDLPGHSTQLWSKYPEVFGSVDTKTGKAMPLYVVNMAKEETYQACRKIINSLAAVFHTSPYIHIGGDEVYLEAIKQVPGYKTYCEENELYAALEGDANELFCHFINRIHRMIKATGKQSLVWEGFHGTGAGRETISKEITVIVWNASYNHPDSLVSNGYKIVNSTWVPWYMVGAMNLAPSVEKGYQWEVTQWKHWDDQYEDIEIPHGPFIIGGQISYWEQNYYKVIPVLRERVPVLAERLWNYQARPDFENYRARARQADKIYSRLFQPVSIMATNLLNTKDLTFHKTLEIALSTNIDGEARYSTSIDWGIPGKQKMVPYKNTISIDESTIVTAQLFDRDGKRVGFPTQQYFRKIEPAYNYTVFGPAPTKGWGEIPGFKKLDVLRKGVTGKMTPGRLEKINGELFAKVKREGHIETRFPGIYNQYALELTGRLKIPSGGTYEWQLQTWDGLAEIYVDGELIAKGNNFENEPEYFKTDMTVGIHSFSIKYYYKQIQNQLSIQYRTGDMQEFQPFEDLVIPLK